MALLTFPFLCVLHTPPPPTSQKVIDVKFLSISLAAIVSTFSVQAFAFPFKHLDPKYKTYELECYDGGGDNIAATMTDYEGAKFLNDWCKVNGPGHYPEITLDVAETYTQHSLRRSSERFDYYVYFNGEQVADHHIGWSWIRRKPCPTIVVKTIDGKTVTVPGTPSNDDDDNGGGNNGGGNNGGGKCNNGVGAPAQTTCDNNDNNPNDGNPND